LEEYESHDPRSPKNAQTVSKIEVDEDIARKQGHVQFLAAIFPAAHTPVHWKETIQPPAFEMARNELLMSRANRDRVPSLGLHVVLDQRFKQNAAR
jgi:hypothetical protein